jgi:hypothetical protein
MDQFIGAYPPHNFRNSRRWGWPGASYKTNVWLLTSILMLMLGVPARKTDLHWDWHSPHCLYLTVPFCAHFKTEISQAAKDVIASHDMLLDLFQRMDDFFKRFKLYSRSLLSTELTGVLVKVLVKVLNILSIAMKEVERSRASESFLRF